MNIIDFRKICFDKHNRAYFLRVQPDDLKVTLSQIFYVLSDLSWISNFDEDYIRESLVFLRPPAQENHMYFGI